MKFGNKEIDGLITGALGGLTVGFIYALIAGGIIAPLMTGSLVYSHGSDLAGAIIGEIIQDIILGAILGAIGAFVAMYLSKQTKQQQVDIQAHK